MAGPRPNNGAELVASPPATGAARIVESFNGLLEREGANRIAAVLSVTIDPDESRRIYLRHTSNREAMRLLRHATVAINPPNERGRIETVRSLHQRIVDLDKKRDGASPNNSASTGTTGTNK